MKHKLYHQTHGAASLITVIFVSIILSILVLGFVRLAISEQRQSTDDDLTGRAFYAAESGLEDAKRAIRQWISDPSSLDLNADNCAAPVDASQPTAFNPVLSAPSEFDTEYTCMLLDMTPPNYEAFIEKGETKQIVLSSVNDSPFEKVRIRWHIKAAQPQGDGANPALRNTKTLPREDQWKNAASVSYPSMLRSYMFSYSTPTNRSDLNSRVNVAFLNPATSSNGGINYATTPSNNIGVHNSQCSSSVASGNFVCEQVYNVNGGGSNREIVLRLTSLYASTHVRVEILHGADQPVSFEGLQALVDVTGRAGDVYRRVETRLDISGTVASLLPDQAILSADDICKNLIVGDANNPSVFQPNNCAVSQ